MSGRPAYCQLDARPATYVGIGLDGTTPLVRCHWTDARGKDHGHGLTLGTFDGEGQAALLDRRRLDRIAAAHPDHRTKHGFHRECPACLARGEHLDHIERSRAAPGCAECERALTRAWSARVGA